MVVDLVDLVDEVLFGWPEPAEQTVVLLLADPVSPFGLLDSAVPVVPVGPSVAGTSASEPMGEEHPVASACSEAYLVACSVYAVVTYHPPSCSSMT